MNDDMATKLYLEILDMKEKMATKAEMSAQHSAVMSSIDRLAKTNETSDQEIVAMRGRQDRLEEQIQVIEHTLGLAT